MTLGFRWLFFFAFYQFFLSNHHHWGIFCFLLFWKHQVSESKKSLQLPSWLLALRLFAKRFQSHVPYQCPLDILGRMTRVSFLSFLGNMQPGAVAQEIFKVIEQAGVRVTADQMTLVVQFTPGY